MSRNDAPLTSAESMAARWGWLQMVQILDMAFVFAPLFYAWRRRSFKAR
jgi:hypothetical protein